MPNKFKWFVESFFYSNQKGERQIPQEKGMNKIPSDSFKSNDEIFKGFIENLPVMFYAVAPNPPFQPIYLSSAFERLGFTMEDWEKNPELWIQSIYEEDREKVLAQTETSLNAGETNDYEYRLNGKNGEIIWVRDRRSLVFDKSTQKSLWQGILIDITEQKLAEEELKKREGLYRAISRNIPLTGIVIFDHDLRFTLAEGELLQAMELTSKMVEGKTLFEVFPKKISEDLERYYRAALAGGFISIEKEIEDKELIIHNYLIPLKNEKKEIYGAMSILQDVTEDRRKTKKLRESEERYRELFDGANDLVYVHDIEGNYLSINRAGEKVFGYDAEEIKKLNMKEVIAPEFLPIASKMMAEKLAKGKKQTVYELECIAKDKRKVILEINSSVVFKDDKPFAIQGIARDITERKQTQEALVESEGRLRNLFENANDLIYLIDLNGKFISVNKAIEEQFGYKHEELEQMHFSQILAPEYVELGQQLMNEKLNGVTRTVYEIVCLTKTGKRRTLEVNSSPMFKNGKVVAIQGIARDITERKIADKKIQESEAELRALFGSMNDVVMVFDKNGRYLKIPPTNPTLLYKPSEELIGKTIKEVFPSSYADYFLSKIKESLELNAPVNVEYSLKIAEREVWFSAVFTPMTEDSVVVVARDITAHKKDEKLIRESESEFRALFAAMTDLVLVFNREGRYLKIPPTNPKLLFKPAAELIGKTMHEVLTKEEADFFLSQIHNSLDTNSATTFDYQMKVGRKTSWFSTVISPMGDDSVLTVTRDITKRKAAEDSLRESEKKYRDLFENANDLIYTIDLQENFTSLNRAGEKITGYKRNEALKGKVKMAQVVAPEHLTKARKKLAEKIGGKKPTTYELEIIAKNGNRVPLELSTRVIYQDGKPSGVQGIARDISERKKSEEAIKASERQYRFLSEGIMHQVWTAQPDGKLDYVNGRTLEYFAKKSEELISSNWMSVVHPDDLSDCIDKWTQSLLTGTLYEVEFRLQRHDGEYRWHRALATAGLDSQGNIVKWFGTNTDIHDQKVAEEKLNYFAKHDTLTNLPNRVKFMSHLKRVISRAEFVENFKFAVLFIDLDRFKLINDSLGHIIGDKLLVEFAERLETCVRPGDIVARLGGDEFTILLNNLKEVDDAILVTNRLVQKLNEPFYLDDYEVFTSASIGIVVSDEIKRQPEDFLRDADTAMYRAKEAGKARYEIFNSEMHIKNMTLLKLENDLRRAIERNEFRVVYQPIVSLETGEICEFEALIRWQHPEHGLVEPQEFIKVAEETGLIIPIGNWIIKEACRQTADWQVRFPQSNPFLVSVNLSAKQLLHPPLNSYINTILSETGLNPRSLRLEVTESVVMGNDEVALNVLNELSKIGVSLSTDDFGTGYSSLSYLHRFPFDSLKIDHSFIGQIDTDKKSSEIVRTILMLAQNLNLEAIAEGIETEEQLRQLQSLGCRFGQGYLFSKPARAVEIERLLIEKSNGFRFAVPSCFQRNMSESAEIH